MGRLRTRNRSRDRWRRRTGWTLTALGLLLSALMIVSGWYKMEFFGGGACVQILGGSIVCGDSQLSHRSKWTVEYWYPSGETYGRLEGVTLRPRIYSMDIVTLVECSLAFPAAALGIPGLTLLAFGFFKRARPGQCVKCRYDMKGLATCPECGEPAA